MNLDLNDFAVFDEPQYQKYQNLRNDYQENFFCNRSSDELGCFHAVLGCLGLITYFIVADNYKFFGLDAFLPRWVTEIVAVALIYMSPVVGVMTATILERSYFFIRRFLFKETKSYKTLIQLKKRYLPQEELIAAKIKSHLGEDISWNTSASFLSKNPEFLSYVEKAQEKIGSTYPVLKSDIKKAKEIITDRYRKSETAFADNTYQPSSKTTTAKKAPSKVKLRPQSSSSTINAASSQSSSPSNLKSPSRTRAPSINVSRKAKPVQPRLTNWKKVNLSRLEIGEQEEELVLQYEQRRLERIGLGHLVEKIEHSSKVVGDGLGYDIKSFDRQGQTIYIEVKTTRGEFWNNLIFTRNELDVMKRIDQQYVLYRVYCLDDEGNEEISMMRGYEEISKHFSFIPQSFVAKHNKSTTN